MDYKFLLLLVARAILTVSTSDSFIEDQNYSNETSIENANVSVDQCTDFYSFHCDSTNQDYNIINITKYLEREYVKFENYVKSMLDHKSYQGQYKSLYLEKYLYKECKDLEKARDSVQEIEVQKTFNNLIQLYTDVVKYNENIQTTWQSVDRELYKMGFGYAFFDINVIPSSEKSNEHIIMIQPPSLKSLNDTYQMLKNIYFDKKLNDIQWSKTTFLIRDRIVDFYKSVGIKEAKSILEIFNKLIEAIITGQNENLHKITDLFTWRRRFNRGNYKQSVTHIYWDELLIKTFQEAGVVIKDTESLIVKNVPYFSLLFNTLYDWWHDNIGAAIVLKALTEHLRYFDWDLAQKLKYIERETFCFHETKLYGASHKMLKGDDKFNNGKLHELLRNIFRSMQSEIKKAESTSFKEEDQLLAKLDIISANHINKIWNDDRVFEYYDNINLSNNYLDNIIKYRKMIKNKELTSLKNNPKTIFTPFSILELEKPSNRFTFNKYVLSNTFQFFDHKWPVQLQYGKFGTRMASLLYALLNENTFENFEPGLTANPKYSEDKLKCFLSSEDLKDKRKAAATISDIYGIRLAYDAMTNYITYDDTNDVNIFPDLFQKYEYDLSDNNSKNKLFYTAYAKTKCGSNDTLVNTVVYNEKSFRHLFSCPTHSICYQTGFD